MDYKIQEIITRVLEGEASSEDRKTLIDWIKSSEENRRELEKTEAFWNALEIINNRENFNPKDGYDDFVRYIGTITHSARKKQKLYKYVLRFAASLLLVMSVSYITYRITKTTSEAIAYFELTTPNGSHTQLTLTDGTIIWLNAGSKLRYPNKFDDTTRTVYLDGEAFFNVKKDLNHPFIVQTSEIKVKALGTSFNVKAYPNEGSIETTLINGEVIVEGNKTSKNEKNSIRLLPNQRATFIKTEGRLLLNDDEQKKLAKSVTTIHPVKREKESLIISKEVKTELYTSWIENLLMFDNEPFESIACKMERRYGATIIFSDNNVKKYRFSGKFPEISIDRVLIALQYASPFNYQIKHDTIFIK